MSSSQPFTRSGRCCVAELYPVWTLGPPSSSSYQLCEYFIFAFHFSFFLVPPTLTMLRIVLFPGVHYLLFKKKNFPPPLFPPPPSHCSPFITANPLFSTSYYLLLTFYYLHFTLQLTIYFLLSAINYLLITFCNLFFTI